MRVRPRAAAARPRSRLAAVVVFAAAMGWLEAVVVVYIRALLGMPRGNATPEPAEMLRALRSLPWLVPTEQGREAATLVMLAAVGLLAARSLRARVGAFLVVFGVWDIAYYVSLRVLVGWPTSLATRDLLFLIPPHPLWVQPVWVPLAISCAMIAVGIRMMRVDSR